MGTDVSDQQSKALEFLKRFIEESDLLILTSFLKFSAGHSFISFLNDPKININFRFMYLDNFIFCL